MKFYDDEQFFDCPFRGVTSALKIVFGDKYDNIPDYILQQAGERGTAVHKYIENYESWFEYKLSEEPHLGLEYSMYEEYFKEFLKERVKLQKVLSIEQRIISKYCSMKGILDAVWTVYDNLENKEYTCLIDFKTSSSLDEWSANCQMQLYYIMLKKGTKSERALASKIQELRCLSLTKTGYKWLKFDIDTELGKAILKLWNSHYKDIAEAQQKK